MSRTEAITELAKLAAATPPELRLSDAVAVLEDVLISHGLGDVAEAFRALDLEWA
ncbi:hypothetical protein [Aurantimonas sp. VKM B-3413]|uniref:hypothetical protein n=1 Tax=Aurantimonas sp. VKM B-3413 TaxID=2779401 RepID=UPI001E5DF720|nr:hypothetical protein [Aurantimonas sp. VKM B-3413]MCB8835912.1 hypothetical protein [Aurantimonas sp. VKM B-3413]